MKAWLFGQEFADNIVRGALFAGIRGLPAMTLFDQINYNVASKDKTSLKSAVV